MKLKYDAKADRMRLAIEQGDQSPRVFWLTRSQCLGWLAELSGITESFGLEPPQIDFRNQVPRSPTKEPSIDALIPEHLDGIRVRGDEQGARIAFLQGKASYALKLRQLAMLRLQEMLVTQAERAGWDPAAGLERLKAMSAARAAINRSKDDNA